MEYKRTQILFSVFFMFFPACLLATTIVMNREDGSSMFNGSDLVAEGKVIKIYEQIDIGCEDCFAYFYDLKISNVYKGIEKEESIITIAAFNEDFVAYVGQNQLVFLSKGVSNSFSNSAPTSNEAGERRKNIYKTYPFVTPFIEIYYVNNKSMYLALSCEQQQFPFEFDESVVSETKSGDCRCFRGSYEELTATLATLQGYHEK